MKSDPPNLSMTREPWDLIVILGPTASGKTRLAARLAYELGSEIISADSRQVYQGLDIGAGKDLSEYVVQGRRIPCHLIDVADPALEEFSVFEFRKRFTACFTRLRSRGVLPVLVGGTGLYLESVLLHYALAEVPENPALREELEGLDDGALERRLLALRPALHNTTDLRDRGRLIRAIEIAEGSGKGREAGDPAATVSRPLVIGVRWDRPVLRKRITRRLEKRIREGMIEEVRGLRRSGVSWEQLHRLGLEYRWVSLHLQGRISLDEMFQVLNTRIHQFAKRQETWFRRMERRGIEIHWIDGEDDHAVRALVFRPPPGESQEK